MEAHIELPEAGTGQMSSPTHPGLVSMSSWVPLHTSAEELTLDHCLPTGQSFRWYQETPGMFVGVIGPRLVRMCQTGSDCYYQVVARAAGVDASADDHVIRDYFNLPITDGAGAEAGGGVRLTELNESWVKACTRYAAIQPYIKGARMLRQDPLECLMQFICSSNNHISRIHGMVERLCSSYGTPLLDSALLPTPPPLPHSTQPAMPPSLADAAVAVKGSPASGCGLDQTVGVVTSDGGTASGGGDKPGSSDAEAAAAAPGKGAQQGKGSRAGKRAKVSADAASTPLKAEAAVAAAAHTTPTGRVAAADSESDADSSSDEGKGRKRKGGAGVKKKGGGAGGSPVSAKPLPATFYAFPTLDQLSLATEEELRAAGFGYRAKFIVGSVAYLREQPGGGQAWLAALRTSPYKDAHTSLSELPGVGPKVAACVCLFSLDKHEAIPVDTHVWQIATKYYSLKAKSLTKKVHDDVQQAFVDRFGPYAGWAHNAMFISELASHKHLVP